VGNDFGVTPGGPVVIPQKPSNTDDKFHEDETIAASPYAVVSLR